jgi:hypothetical protein
MGQQASKEHLFFCFSVTNGKAFLCYHNAAEIKRKSCSPEGRLQRRLAVRWRAERERRPGGVGEAGSRVFHSMR